MHRSGTISAELEKGCSEEPIELLGTVQPYGFLMTVDIRLERIVQVSSGIARHWPGLREAGVLIGAPLFDWIERRAPLETLALEALPRSQPMALPWRARFERTAPNRSKFDSAKWECLGHLSGEVAVLEWLPQATAAEQLRMQNRNFSDIAAIVARLRHAEKTDAFLSECAQIAQGFTGFDRAMIYRFLSDGSGEVVAEHTVKSCPQKFLGLRYPASDIAAQTRALYLSNRLHVLADVEARPDMLAPPALLGGEPLDQGHCMLRGLAPVQLTYLRNLGVRAALTMSIVIDGKLWGLIACHHHAPKVPPHQVREGLRQVCELTAEVANMRIETLAKLAAADQRLALSGMLTGLHQALLESEDIAAVLRDRLPEFLKAFKADTFGMHINSLVWVDGPAPRPCPAQRVVTEVLARLDQSARSPGVLMWDDLLTSPQRALQSLPQAAGMLLAQRYEDHTIFCFVTRPEVVQPVRWAGQPGRCEPWSAVEAEALQSLLRIVSEVNKLRIDRTLHEKLRWRDHHDPLTGLYNHRTMEDEVTRRLEAGRVDAALMLLDLDHFKKINESYGHATADQVLLQFGRRLGAVIRDCDLLARLGGDEFMLLFQMDHPDPAFALTFAERLHHAATAPFDINGQQLRMSVSVGIAIPPGHGRAVSELLRRASLALYHAKSQGRSRSALFDFSMESDQLSAHVGPSTPH